MPSFAFLRPRSLDEAVTLLDRYDGGAKAVAGGTALTIMLRQRLIAPEAVVSLDALPGLRSIEVEGGEIHLGALVTHRDVELSPVVRQQIPVLSSAFGTVASVRIRNAATVGGVLAEADYASDPPAVFRALDAVVEVHGPNGARTIPVADFILGFYETALEPNEIVTGVRVPIPPPGTAGVYKKFQTRSSEDRPCLGVAALVRLAGDGTCEDLRVAVGAAADVPQRFEDIEAVGRGVELTDDVIRTIADRYADSIDTLDDMRGSSWYRTETIRVWVRRAIEEARDAAGASR